MTTATTSKKFIDPTSHSTEWKGRSGKMGHLPVTQLDTKGSATAPLNVPHFLPNPKFTECLQKDLHPGYAKYLLPLAGVVAGLPASSEDIKNIAEEITNMVVLEAKKLPKASGPQVLLHLETALTNCTAPPAEAEKPKNSTAQEAAAAALAQIK